MGGTRKIAGLAAPLLAVAMLGCGAAAAGPGDLYQARTIVTGTGEESRASGFADCLAEVLVKVSGDPRLAGEPRLAAVAGKAGTLVRDFRYRDRMAGIPVHDEQGTRDRPHDLTVRFDRAKIDQALRMLGRTPWVSPRPRVAVFVAVRAGATGYMLAGDGDRGRDQRDALATAAERLGLSMVLPGETMLAGAGLSAETLAAADRSRLDATARASGGDVALAGDLVWSQEALGWVADWRLDLGGRTYRWRIAGVSFDQAFLSAMRGAAQILSGNGPPA